MGVLPWKRKYRKPPFADDAMYELPPNRGNCAENAGVRTLTACRITNNKALPRRLTLAGGNKYPPLYRFRSTEPYSQAL